MNPAAIFKRALGLGKTPPKSGFRDLAMQYGERLRRNGLPKNGSGTRVGVVVTPWIFTPVPFFSLECALMLADSGAEVTILWDRSNVFFNAAKQREIDSIAALVASVGVALRFIDVSGWPAHEPTDPGFVDLLLYENAVRRCRGETQARELLRENAEAAEAMRQHAGRVEALLTTEKFDWLLLPGGVWAASGLYAQVARNLGVSFSAFDSGVGSLFLAHDGPAAHFADIPRAFAAVTATATPAERERMVARGWAQLDERRAGRDPFRLQPKSAQGLGRFDLVVPLNYRSDTAALFRQRLFGSVTEWLTQLLDWAGTQPGVRVAIRQHPCERIPEYRGSDAWREVLAPYGALGDRVRFVAAEDPVNSYDLIDGAAAVLPYTSRIGIESAMLGKPVILGTHCYYQDCGFVQNPATREEYFAQLGQALRGELVPDAAARESAAITYYLAECCLPLTTNFTPQPSDYLEWVGIPPDDLWSTPACEDLLEALLSRQSVACVQHRRFFNLK